MNWYKILNVICAILFLIGFVVMVCIGEYYMAFIMAFLIILAAMLTLTKPTKKQIAEPVEDPHSDYIMD